MDPRREHASSSWPTTTSTNPISNPVDPHRHPLLHLAHRLATILPRTTSAAENIVPRTTNVDVSPDDCLETPPAPHHPRPAELSLAVSLLDLRPSPRRRVDVRRAEILMHDHVVEIKPPGVRLLIHVPRIRVDSTERVDAASAADLERATPPCG